MTRIKAVGLTCESVDTRRDGASGEESRRLAGSRAIPLEGCVVAFTRKGKRESRNGTILRHKPSSPRPRYGGPSASLSLEGPRKNRLAVDAR